MDWPEKLQTSHLPLKQHQKYILAVLILCAIAHSVKNIVLFPQLLDHAMHRSAPHSSFCSTLIVLFHVIFHFRSPAPPRVRYWNRMGNSGSTGQTPHSVCTTALLANIVLFGLKGSNIAPSIGGLCFQGWGGFPGRSPSLGSPCGCGSCWAAWGTGFGGFQETRRGQSPQ